MLMVHQGSPRGRRVWNRPRLTAQPNIHAKRCICSNMAHPARPSGSPRPPSNSVSTLSRRSGTKVKYIPSTPPRLPVPLPPPIDALRQSSYIRCRFPLSPYYPTPSPHSFSNPPAFLINLFSSPDVRWSGFNFRSRAIASTSPRCLATSLDRYPTSPSDKNLGAPRLLLSSEIFSSPGDANNQLGNCTKNFIKFHPLPSTTELGRLIAVRGPNCVQVHADF